MKKNDFEFDLDDIIREFSDPEEAVEAVPAETVEEAPEEAQNEAPGEEIPEDPGEAPEETPSPVTGDTIRMDPSQLPKGTYTGAAPICEEEEAQEELPEGSLQDTRDFSGPWEPEYEQPIGEYVPQQPILFHPRSRLRELKKKLVAGPEKLYYELTEKGSGKLQALLFLSLLTFLICAGATVLYALGWVQADRMRLMIFSQLICMLISALLGSFQLIEGLGDLVKGRFSLKTLLIFSLILCSADGILCLQALRVPCCAAFCLQISLSLWDSLLTRRTQIGQLDTLRRATNLTALRAAAEKEEDYTVLTRDEGQVEDFMDTYGEQTAPQKLRSWYALGALCAALAVGITGAVLHGISTGVQIAAVTLLAAVPASFFVSLSRPAYILQNRLSRLGTVLCGWSGIDAAGKKVLFPLSHSDLFPGGAVKLNGFKYLGNRHPDEVLAYGASVLAADGSGLTPIFDQLLERYNCHHLTAADLQRYDHGLAATVRGERVLVGSLPFLEEMGVEIPEGLRVSQAVCVAVEGVLCGLFAITYEKTRSAAAGLHTLCAYRGLKPVLCAGDFLLSLGFLRSRMGVAIPRLEIADAQRRSVLSQAEPDREAPAMVLCTGQDLAGFAYGITGARALKSAQKLGTVLHMEGGILGIGIMLTLTIIGATHLLTPVNVLMYQLVWSIPGFLLTEWTRII